jgi:hypothetical protein
MICAGKYSALTDFPKADVLRNGTTPYYHIEVVASVPTRSSSRAGRTLIREVGSVVLRHAKYVTASAATDIGVRLCKYFGFRHLTDEDVVQPSGDVRRYPIFGLRLDANAFQEKLERF